MASLSRRSVLKSGAAAALAVAFPARLRAERRTVMNDASRLSPTPVAIDAKA